MLDAAKIAISALDHPGLLGSATWVSSTGYLSVVRERERGSHHLALVAVSTRPNTAAHVAPRAPLRSILVRPSRRQQGRDFFLTIRSSTRARG